MISFDMDGVLVKYDWDGYTTKVDGVLKYLTPGYFLEREPDNIAIELCKKCMELFPNETYIITSVPNNENRNRVVLEKLNWVDKHIPGFDIGTHVICTTSNKMSFIEWLRGSTITEKDILIDDFNKNIYSWLMRGGTSVKWLNGLNSQDTWFGPYLDGRGNVGVDRLFEQLVKIYNGRVKC